MARVTTIAGRPGLYVEWTDGHGRWHRQRVYGSRREATRLCRELEAKADRQRLGLDAASEPTPRQEMGLEALAAAWRDWVLVHRAESTWESYALGLEQVFAWLGSQGREPQSVGDLRLEDMTSFAKARRAAGLAIRTVNMRIGAVRTLLNWGVEHGHVRANPLAGWKPIDWRRVKGGPPRERPALTAGQIEALLAASPAELADVWRFLLGTGLRSGELGELAWPDVDWERRRIRVRTETTKGRRDRHVDLRDDLVAVLRRQRERMVGRMAAAEHRVGLAEALARKADGDGGRQRAARRLAQAQRATETAGRLVFTNTGGGPWQDALSRRLKPCLAAARRWARERLAHELEAMDKASLLPLLEAGAGPWADTLDRRLTPLYEALRMPDADVHALRHTFGSHLIAAGVDVKQVAELMGHASPQVTLKHYAHVLPGRGRDAVELIPLPDGRIETSHPRRTRAVAQ